MSWIARREDEKGNPKQGSCGTIKKDRAGSMYFHIYTPKINIEPENDGLDDDFHFSRGIFSGSMLIFHIYT